MLRKLMWMLVVSSVILGATLSVSSVQATPASGFSGTTVAQGRFKDFDVQNRALLPDNLQWLSLQRTKGPSDLYVQLNVWQLNGTTGWHTHPGHSLIIVTVGTLTYYDGDDPSCTPHVLTPGMGYVDAGGDHVHVVRNEGSVVAQGYAVQLIPAAATRRIDANANPACKF